MALDSYFANTIQQPATGTGTATRSVFPAYGTNFQNPNEMVSDAMGSALDPNSQYIQNARRRGLETAATRGGINSSIAAGASERAAIEAAMPLAQSSLDIQRQREQVQAEEWMSEQNFNRAMMGQYGQTAFASSMNMLQSLQQFALEDPELYTPDVVSGMSDFFGQNFNNYIGRFFGRG